MDAQRFLHTDSMEEARVMLEIATRVVKIKENLMKSQANMIAESVSKLFSK